MAVEIQVVDERWDLDLDSVQKAVLTDSPCSETDLCHLDPPLCTIRPIRHPPFQRSH